MNKMPEIAADICIVGAGIVGLAHAYEARRRGLSVVVLDREDRPVGASVRNFGHVFVAALADGADLECGLVARQRWRELSRRADVGLVEAGTVLVARAEDELAVLEASVGDPRRGARLITPQEVEQTVPVPVGAIVGALHGTLDLRVDPRRAVSGLAATLTEDPDAEVRWGTAVDEIEPGRVQSGDLRVAAEQIFVCPGPDLRGLPAALRVGVEHLTLCRLQMLRVVAPSRRRYAPALATGLSLIRYPAFAHRAEARALHERLARERPELVEHGVHLLVTQLPDGDLVIGDTHLYGDSLSPFGDERLDEILLEEAGELLGAERLTVRERWHGIYPSGDPAGFLATEPLPGVHVLEVTSGLGMTMSFGHAVRTFDRLAARPRQPPAAERGGPAADSSWSLAGEAPS